MSSPSVGLRTPVNTSELHLLGYDKSAVEWVLTQTEDHPTALDLLVGHIAHPATLSPMQVVPYAVDEEKPVEVKRIRSLQSQPSRLLDLPPELLVEITGQLACPGPVDHPKLSSAAFVPGTSREITFELILEVMHGHGASLGGVTATSAFACTCGSVASLVTEAALERAVPPGLLLSPDAHSFVEWPTESIPALQSIRANALPRADRCLVAHLGELESMHFTFLTSQGWAHPTTASLAAASTKLPQHAGSPVHWPASFPAADDPATQQLIALLRSRAARWSTVRRSLWVLRLPFSMHRAVCRIYAPPAWPKCRDVNLRMREILVDWLVEVVSIHTVRASSGQAAHWPEQSLHLAVLLLDHYMLYVGATLSRSKLQLVGIAALLCAVQYEANPARLDAEEAVWTRAATSRRLANLSDDAYTADEVTAMADDMLSRPGIQRLPSLTQLAPATAMSVVLALTSGPRLAACGPPIISGSPSISESGQHVGLEPKRLTRRLRDYASFLTDLCLVYSPFVLTDNDAYDEDMQVGDVSLLPREPKPGVHARGSHVGAAALLLAAHLEALVTPLSACSGGAVAALHRLQGGGNWGQSHVSPRFLAHIEALLGAPLATINGCVRHMCRHLASELNKMEALILAARKQSEPEVGLKTVVVKHRAAAIRLATLLAKGDDPASPDWPDAGTELIAAKLRAITVDGIVASATTPTATRLAEQSDAIGRLQSQLDDANSAIAARRSSSASNSSARATITPATIPTNSATNSAYVTDAAAITPESLYTFGFAPTDIEFALAEANGNGPHAFELLVGRASVVEAAAARGEGGTSLSHSGGNHPAVPVVEAAAARGAAMAAPGTSAAGASDSDADADKSRAEAARAAANVKSSGGSLLTVDVVEELASAEAGEASTEPGEASAEAGEAHPEELSFGAEDLLASELLASEQAGEASTEPGEASAQPVTPAVVASSSGAWAAADLSANNAVRLDVNALYAMGFGAARVVWALAECNGEPLAALELILNTLPSSAVAPVLPTVS